MPNRTVRIAIMSAATVVVAGVWAFQRGPLESPTHRAHRLCTGCGLDVDEVDWLIEEMRLSPMDREGKVRLWEQTYDDPDKLAEDRELCMPCVETVLDAAGVE